MLKITTRIFTATTMAAMLIGINTGAFACEGCVPAPAKSAAKMTAKTTKPVAKTVANAKIAPKIAKKSATKTVALPLASVKTVATQTSAKNAAPACPHCQPAEKVAKN